MTTPNGSDAPSELALLRRPIRDVRDAAAKLEPLVHLPPERAYEQNAAHVLDLAEALIAALRPLASPAAPSADGGSDAARMTTEFYLGLDAAVRAQQPHEVAGLAMIHVVRKRERLLELTEDAPAWSRLDLLERLGDSVARAADAVDRALAVALGEETSVGDIARTERHLERRRMCATLWRAFDAKAYSDVEKRLRGAANAITVLLGGTSFEHFRAAERHRLRDARDRILEVIRAGEAHAPRGASIARELDESIVEMQRIHELPALAEHDAQLAFRATAGLRWLARQGTAVPDDLFARLKNLDGRSADIERLLRERSRNAQAWLDAIRPLTDGHRPTGPLARRPAR